jgi:hypothetical protein
VREKIIETRGDNSKAKIREKQSKADTKVKTIAEEQVGDKEREI